MTDSIPIAAMLAVAAVAAICFFRRRALKRIQHKTGSIERPDVRDGSADSAIICGEICWAAGASTKEIDQAYHMYPVTARVTLSDVLSGKPRMCYKCPLARAIARQCRPGVEVDVGESSVAFRELGRTVTVELSAKAVEFVKKFDANPTGVRKRFRRDLLIEVQVPAWAAAWPRK